MVGRGGWRGTIVGTQGGDGGEQFSTVADRGHADADQVVGKAITTVEGLGTPDRPHPLQQAFLDEQAGQCGYCLPGILISAKALLDRNLAPTRAEIGEALDDNICRCGSHVRILHAVERAARVLREGGAR